MIKDLILSGDQKAIADYISVALEGVEQTVPSWLYGEEPEEGWGNYPIDWTWKISSDNGKEGLLFIAPDNNVDICDEFFTYEELDDLYNGDPILPCFH